MNFEELPDIPGIWLDFLKCRLPFQPAFRSMPALIAHANALRNQPMPRQDLCQILANAKDLCSDRTLENLQRLQQPESVVVMASFYPDLFGGEAYQILKCLTAIKICEELARHDLIAIPVCWIDTSSSHDVTKRSIQLLDSESELHCLQLEASAAKAFSPCDLLPSSQIGGLLSRVEELGRGTFDPEILEILKNAFSGEATFAHASARLIASLLKEWGMIVINPHAPELQSYADKIEAALPADPIQSAMLPVLACVIDPYEVDSYGNERRSFEASKRVQPMAWPQASATIIDIRSRRTLERYNLDLYQLYSGQKKLIAGFADEMPNQASEKLFSLRQEAEERIARLRALYSSGNNFGKEADSAREKIVFQLDRIRENFDAACRRKQETIDRQIRRACNSLAPNGRIQERELAGVYLPLRHSRAVLRSLYEKLDILSLEHQLIFMD